MNPAEHSLDIILPLYHPHEGWDSHIEEAISALRQHLPDVTMHFYLVNDGTPRSAYPEETLHRLRAVADGRFELLFYENNRGKGYSLRYGVSHASGEFQIYTDGDFPFGWKAVADAYEKLSEGADVVMGIRGSEYGKKLMPGRKLLSKGVRVLNSLLLGLPEENLDAQAGLKGFNPTGREQFLATTVDTFLFDTEFILLSRRHHLNIATIPLTLRPGLIFSNMGWKVMLRELRHFIRILWKIRICRTR